VSQSEQVRPLLSPGEVRELPVDDQLVFVTGYKPMRVKKLRYYADATLKHRLLPAPSQTKRLDVPAHLQGEWFRERAKGPQLLLPPSRMSGWPDSPSASRGQEMEAEADEISSDESAEAWREDV
jgi:type IV secretion system protein VirD4